MKKLYKEIRELNSEHYDLDTEGNTYLAIFKAIAKLGEEYGEFITAFNHKLGIKNKGRTEKQIKENIVEEAADTIQNVFSLCIMSDITYEEIVNALEKKNQKWKKMK